LEVPLYLETPERAYNTVYIISWTAEGRLCA